MKDVTGEGRLSQSHALIEHLANEILDISPLDLYRRYLSITLGTNCSTGLSDFLEDAYVEKFYAFTRSPKYFNFRSYYDVNKMIEVINLPIVILKSSTRDLKNLTKLIDTRLTHYLHNNKSEEPVFYITLTDDDLYYAGRKLDEYSCLLTEAKFMSDSALIGDQCCLVQAIRKLFGKSLPHIGNCVRDPLTLCFNEDGKTFASLGLSHAVSVVTHVSSNPWVKPKGQLFITLGVLKEPGKVVNWRDMAYVSVPADREGVYRLKREEAEKLLKTRDNYLKKYKLTEDEKRGFPEEEKKEKPCAKEEEEEEKINCPCKYCRLARTYTSKQLKFGPQKLHANPLTLFEYLVFFNLDTETNRRLILKCCNLTMATLDFECYSRQELLHPLNNVPRDIVTDAKLGTSGTPLVSQKPVLFCHLDCLGNKREKYHYRVFQVPNDASFTLAVKNYVEHLLERKKMLTTEKLRLLEPLLRFVQCFKIAYKQFFRVRKKKPIDVRLAFAASPFGQFEKALNKLAYGLKVYSFNGASYDHVLLARNIVAACCSIEIKKDKEEKEKVSFESSSSSSGSDDDDEEEEKTITRPRVKISREGSKINNILLPNVRIGFYDLKKFLPPNATLDKLAKMTDCGDSKGMFPFELLTSFDYLVETKTLPGDPEAWKSRLNGKMPSQEQVDRCLDDFKKDGHENLLSYLTKYLVLDVKLLMEAGIKLFLSFYEQVGSHPITAGKNSLSSFSYASLQKHLFENKIAGAFVPNHPVIFSIVKGSLLGGVSLVCRTDGGLNAKEPVNSHLGPEYNKKPKKVLYWDLNALYGTSGNSHSSLGGPFTRPPFFSRAGGWLARPQPRPRRRHPGGDLPGGQILTFFFFFSQKQIYIYI